MLFTILAPVIVCFGLLWLYQKLTWGVCKSDTNLSRKTVIVTGANTGIGLEVATDLASRNAKVIIACRDQVKGRLALKYIQEETGNKNVVLKELDLSSLASVHSFAHSVVKEEKSLHILINNAGVCNLPYGKTDDGLEINMATNHFGPFLLTILLSDLLKKSAPARVINTTSTVHSWIGSMNLENINSDKYFSRSTIYGQTKLANVLFTTELSRKLKGSGVTVNCIHPGTVQTELLRHLYFPINYVMKLMSILVFKNVKQGAQTTIHCAVSENIKDVTGKYFCDCKVTSPGKAALDDGVAKKLWELSEKYTDCKFV